MSTTHIPCLSVWDAERSVINMARNYRDVVKDRHTDVRATIWAYRSLLAALVTLEYAEEARQREDKLGRDSCPGRASASGTALAV